MRGDLHVTELWTAPTKEDLKAAEKRHETIKAQVQDLIFANIAKIHLTFQSEDGTDSATLADLQSAVEMARTEELEKFLSSKAKKLSFEDGCISVKFK